MPPTDEQQAAVKRIEGLCGEKGAIREDTRPLTFIKSYDFATTDVLAVFESGRYVLAADGDMKLILPSIKRV